MPWVFVTLWLWQCLYMSRFCISQQSSRGQDCVSVFVSVSVCIFRQSSWGQQTRQFLLLHFCICICLGLVFSDNPPGDTIAHPAVRLIQCGRWWEYWTWNDLLSGSQKESADFILLSSTSFSLHFCASISLKREFPKRLLWYAYNYLPLLFHFWTLSQLIKNQPRAKNRFFASQWPNLSSEVKKCKWWNHLNQSKELQTKSNLVKNRFVVDQGAYHQKWLCMWWTYLNQSQEFLVNGDIRSFALNSYLDINCSLPRMIMWRRSL